MALVSFGQLNKNFLGGREEVKPPSQGLATSLVARSASHSWLEYDLFSAVDW